VPSRNDSPAQITLADGVHTPECMRFSLEILTRNPPNPNGRDIAITTGMIQADLTAIKSCGCTKDISTAQPINTGATLMVREMLKPAH